MKPIIQLSAILLMVIIPFLLPSCSADPAGEAPEPAQELSLQLQISTRANGGKGVAYKANSNFTLTIKVDGTEYTLPYWYDGSSWYDATPGTLMSHLPLVNNKAYPAYAYGELWVPYGNSGNVEIIPVAYTGTLTPAVTAGEATAAIELTFATARFKVTLKGSYGEADSNMPDFAIAPQFYDYVTDANGIVWNSFPADPYTEPRTPQVSTNILPYSYKAAGGLSLAMYPAGQTLAAGEPLFKIWSNDLPTTSPYYSKEYTIANPTALTLAAGHQYNYTVRLTGGGQAVIESVTISDFTNEDPTAIETNKPGISTGPGISTEAELRQFITDYNSGVSSKYAHWFDATGTVRLLADIDIAPDADPLPPIDWLRNGHIFDGGGHTISGATISAASSIGYCGFIGNNRGIIRHLHLRGATVGNDTDASRTGGICGTNFDGTVIACSFGGTVTSTNTAGSICGWNTSTIAGCYSLATAITANTYKGAISGVNYGTINGCIWQEATGIPTDAAGDDSGSVSNCSAFDGTWTAQYITTMNAAIQSVNDAAEGEPGSGASPVCPGRWVLFPGEAAPRVMLVSNP